MSDDVELLRRVYALFNGREIESVLAAMHPEVVWDPKTAEPIKPQTRIQSIHQGVSSRAERLAASRD